ncbi:MAG: cytochrome c oxidase assembly protein [Actinomycetota bacterium]|nr:cytochrome c oxidase assembly protein [Actinomycetota bacterium]
MTAMSTDGMGGMGTGGMGAGSQVVDAHSILTGWAVGPFAFAVAVVAVAVAVWYLRAAHRRTARAADLAQAHAGRSHLPGPWPRSRSLSFVAGLAVIEIAIGSSVATLSDSHFTAHILQHLCLMMIAPPLLALGAPMTLLLQTSSRPTKRRLLAALHSPVFAVIGHPVPVFFAYYASMFAFFLSPALGYAMDNMWLMDIWNIFFFAGATLFWWPMVGTDPIPRWNMSPGFKLLNLMIGVPFESFLAIALLMKADPAAPMYSLSGTHAAAGILWALSELFTVAAIAPIFVQWTRADARTARRIDARIDAGESMAPPPAAGHGLAATMKSLRRG